MSTYPFQNDLLEIWRQAGGYYQCPKDPGGKRLGPLVGYAGKYTDSEDQQKQYVGDVYYNFAKIERLPDKLNLFASGIAQEIKDTLHVECILAAPMGGLALGLALAILLNCEYVYPEKKITKLATTDEREESVLVLDRHEIPRRTNVLIVEDVCNNFSTTEKLVMLIKQAGAHFCGIGCALNRSNATGYESHRVKSLIYSPTKQYKQEDPSVSTDIQRGNIVWKPKNDWATLQKAMNQNP